MIKMLEEIKEEPRVISECYSKNISLITEIVQTIKAGGVDRIIIAARGTSDHAAVYAKYIMEIMLGIPVTLAAPSIFTVYNGSMKLNHTLVIGVSQSGKAADVLEVLKSANSSGAVTVSITNYADSPMAREARYHLDCSAGAEKSVAATKTFLAEITLLAVLTAVWAGNEKVLAEIQSLPDEIDSIIQSSEYITEKVERYRYMNECFVLARGVNYAVALESALKIQETCYVRAKAYATSDFYHGPYAMIENGMPVIVYAPTGPTLKDVGDMIEKLRESGAELIIVSDNEEIRNLGICSFPIPAAHSDITSPFLNVVVGQIFACHLSLAKGLNPDTPRSLNKVTITR